MAAAQAALRIWTAVPHFQRASIVSDALAYLEADIDLIASIISRDTGLPRKYAREDTLAAISGLREELVANSEVSGERPGIIGQILSWSNPLVVSLRLLTLDLARGNVAIVHPSIRAPLSLVCMADALSRAGAADGIFNVIQGAGIDAGMALARRPELKRLDFQGSRHTAQLVALSTGRNRVPVQAVLRSIKAVNLSTGDDLAVVAHCIVEDCSCHAARPCFGGLQVSLPVECLKGLTGEVRAAFEQVRYLDGDRGARSVAPYLAEKFRTDGEAAVRRYLQDGAELVCKGPAPDERTFRMGWFARPRVLHDVSGAITLDPDEPNGPLVLLKAY